MKIFSNHRRKLEPYRRYGSREFKEKLTVAKNYKRNLNPAESFFSDFFTKTGLSKAGTLIAIILFGVIFYFLVISPYFLISNIVVSGNSQVATSQVDGLISNLSKKRFFLVPKSSFVYLNQSRLNKLFASEMPMIKEVKSKRDWPNKITIQVTERTPALIFEVNSSHYLIDDQGFVIKEVPADADGLTITDQVAEDIKIGTVLSGKIIPFAISVRNQWPTKINVPIAGAKIPGKGAQEVEFITSEGWSVFFSTDRPVTSQLNNLSILLNKQIAPASRTRLAYIDLRLAKWAYYCLKATPCQQTDQASLQPDTAAAGVQNGSAIPAPVDNSAKQATP